MNSLTRGIRNAFRNSIRSIAVAVILAVSIGLALIMLLSLFAVQERIESVRSSVGNTITVTPAGIRGFQGGGELLTTTDSETVASLAHVTGVSEVFTGRLTAGTDISLEGAIEPGSFGQKNNASGQDEEVSGTIQNNQMTAPADFTPPITVSGVDEEINLQNLGVDQLEITDGEMIDGSSEENIALVGAALAEKNGLTAGSTFTAYGAEITVSGIFDADNQFVNGGLIMPIDALRNLSGSADEVNSIVVTVDSSENVQEVDDAVSAELGENVDVVSQLDNSSESLSSLEGVETVARYSFFGALVSASAILFLVMLMIVRERRQEIGVIKAIGASNFKIVKQFISESLTFTLIGGLLGLAIGVVFSNPVLEVLVNSNSSTTTAAGQIAGGPGGPGGGMRGPLEMGGRAIAGQSALENITTVINFDLFMYGLLAAVGIAIIGSAIPAWLIARIRPAEAMRGE